MTLEAADISRVEAFVYHEARLIDDKRFDEWFDLFTDDAFYWIPLARGQADGDNHTSLMYEDKLLLKVRIERLKNPRSFSQHQPSFCQHVLQRPLVERGMEEGVDWVTRTPFFYMETQLDDVVQLAGVSWLHLVEGDDGLAIRLKKVELVNCDAALPSIQLFP